VKECEDHYGISGNESWLLQHDNAPAHSALSIREFLAKNNISMLEAWRRRMQKCIRAQGD